MKRSLILLISILAALALSACGGDIDDFEPTENEAGMVTVSITGYAGQQVLPPTEVKIREGYTCFDVTNYLARKHNIALVKEGSGRGVYVKGIGGLFAGDEGAESGWLYRVNGSFSDTGVSSGAFSLKDGDKIEWLYTVDLGKTEGAGGLSQQ